MSLELAALVKLIAGQVRKGQQFSLSPEIGMSIVRTDGWPEDLVVLFASEMAKARPNAKLLQVYEVILADVFMELVQGAKVERAGMSQILLNIEAVIANLLQQGRLLPDSLLALLRLFQAVGHVPGEAFRDILMNTAPSDTQDLDIDGVIDALAQTIQGMDGDIFAVHQEMAPMLSAMPAPVRGLLGLQMLTNDKNPSVRALGLAWLFDEEEEVRQRAAEGLRQVAERGLLTPEMLRRLILSRNLLPATLHPDIDAAIKAARMKGLDCPPLPAPAVIEFLASGIDGAGAQSLFVQMKQGRKQALVSILLKLDHGVLDAWVKTGMSKAEMSSILDEVDAHMGLNLSGPLYLRQALGHFLAMNVETGQAIPFGLLQVAEILALPSLTPERQPASQDMLRDILAGVPGELTDAKAFEQALKISGHWITSLPIAASWFESDPGIDRLLQGKKRSRQKQVEAILQEWLPGRRDRWIDILTWTGLSMREGDHKDLWVDYLLMARALAEGQHPSALPFMRDVATNTVKAWRYESGMR